MCVCERKRDIETERGREGGLKGNLLFRSFPPFAVFIAERKGKQWLEAAACGHLGK